MDELLHRVMPHSLEAEQAVLGAMLIDSRCVPEVISKLKAADFYLETNRNIYETILTMFNYSEAIDPVTVLEKMRLNGEATESTPRYLVELMNITPTTTNVMEYASVVSDRSLLRAVAETAGEITDIVHAGGGTADEVLEVAEKRIYDLRKGRTTSELEPIGPVLKRVYDKVLEAEKHGSDIPGITTGLPDLDHAIKGLNDSDLIFIASRPGMGKTSIALNITLSAAKSSGKAVAIFSLEMAREQLAMRLLSSVSHVDGEKLKTGRGITKEEWNQLIRSAADISRSKIYLNDNPTLTVSEMNAQCRQVPDLGLIVIDYLQLMSSAGGQVGYNQNRVQVVSEISRFLKIMAKEHNVPVICLSQLSREVEKREDKRPRLSDLRESGSIEQDADIVMGLFREGYYDKGAENPNSAECIILKNRHGDTRTVSLLWQPQYTTYTSLDKRHDVEY